MRAFSKTAEGYFQGFKKAPLRFWMFLYCQWIAVQPQKRLPYENVFAICGFGLSGAPRPLPSTPRGNGSVGGEERGENHYPRKSRSCTNPW
jgi:hypothetical protein